MDRRPDEGRAGLARYLARRGGRGGYRAPPISRAVRSRGSSRNGSRRRPEQYARLTSGGVILAAALVIPAAICLGAAFPIALATLGARAEAAPGRFGLVYAVNTVGSVAGSLAAGFLAIPWLGLQHTLTLVAGMLVAACLVASAWGRVTSGGRVVSLATAAAVAGTPFS